MRSLPAKQRDVLRPRWAACKGEVDAVLKARLVGEDDPLATKYAAVAFRQGQILQAAQQTLDNTEEVAADTLRLLAEQRAQIRDMSCKLGAVNDDLNRSG